MMLLTTIFLLILIIMLGFANAFLGHINKSNKIAKSCFDPSFPKSMTAVDFKIQNQSNPSNSFNKKGSGKPPESNRVKILQEYLKKI